MKVKHSLKISLHGMDSRMQSMMASYLELNCKGIACVAKEFEAEAEIVDVDLADSKNILQERLAQKPAKPIIAISLYDISSPLAIYVKKPIKTQDLIKTINTVKKIFLIRKRVNLILTLTYLPRNEKFLKYFNRTPLLKQKRLLLIS